MNTHGPTRWTTLHLVIEKMVKLWDVFEQYFLTSNPTPLILREFFASREAKTVVYFLHAVLPLFNESIDVLQVCNLINPKVEIVF